MLVVLVLVVMVAVGGMPMPIVRVVDMVIVADGLVPAVRPVRVIVGRMSEMRQRMLVVVVVMRGVRMALVNIIDMPLALDPGMPAVRSVLVLMGGVCFMTGGHGSSLLW